MTACLNTACLKRTLLKRGRAYDISCTRHWNRKSSKAGKKYTQEKEEKEIEGRIERNIVILTDNIVITGVKFRRQILAWSLVVAQIIVSQICC